MKILQQRFNLPSALQLARLHRGQTKLDSEIRNRHFLEYTAREEQAISYFSKLWEGDSSELLNILTVAYVHCDLVS